MQAFKTKKKNKSTEGYEIESVTSQQSSEGKVLYHKRIRLNELCVCKRGRQRLRERGKTETETFKQTESER